MQTMNLINLTGKVAIITGASSGIGQAASILFSKLGARVALVGRQTDKLNQTRDLCLKESSNPNDSHQFLPITADLAKEDDLIRIAKESREKFGSVDILVNNAGEIWTDNIENVSMKEFDRVMTVNCRAPVMLTNLLVEDLIANKGSVVNVSSVNGIRSFPGVMSYCISKAAVDQFTRCAALDLASKNVRVNSVNPGVTVTQLHKRAGMTEEKYAEFLERAKLTHAMGRPGQVDEVAMAIAFLASNASSFTTGTSLPVDGGRHAMCPR